MSALEATLIGVSVTLTAAVVGMFFRIEHRLTKVETILEIIERNLLKCRQP